MVILGIGSNLSSAYGDRFKNINLAIQYLEQYGFQILKRSAFYETPSYPNKSKPKFINIIIQVSTVLPPVDLASVLLFVEKKLGRTRNIKNDPRTCDIDIIDYNNKILKRDVILPHPRMHTRNFVLFPLFEINKNWKHPILKKDIKILICSLSNKDIRSIKLI